MSQTQFFRQRFQPGQRAVVFSECAISGATLGYHCAIVYLTTERVAQYQRIPYRWSYRVFVPYLDGCINAEARNIVVAESFATHDPLPQTLQLGLNLRFQFGSNHSGDHEIITGMYQTDPCGWHSFVFQKVHHQTVGYVLKQPKSGNSSSLGTLSFDVPNDEILDRNYVVREVCRIHGIGDRGAFSLVADF